MHVSLQQWNIPTPTLLVLYVLLYDIMHQECTSYLRSYMCCTIPWYTRTAVRTLRSMVPVIRTHDVKHQARRQLSRAEYSHQGVENGGAPRQAQALIPPNSITRHRHLVVTLLGHSLVVQPYSGLAVLTVLLLSAHCCSTYMWFS